MHWNGWSIAIRGYSGSSYWLRSWRLSYSSRASPDLRLKNPPRTCLRNAAPAEISKEEYQDRLKTLCDL